MTDHGGPASTDRAAALVAETAARFASRLAVEDDDLIAAIAASVEPMTLAAGETLFRAGDPADAAYFVVTGRLLVLQEGEGGEIPLRRLSHGEILGELGLLDEAPRTASVRADRDCILARLPQAAFEELAERHPAFLRGVVRVVVDRLARPRPSIDRVSTIALAVTAPGIDPAVVHEAVRSAGARRGPVALISPRHETDLELDRAIDRAESSHRFVLLSVDDAAGGPGRRGLRHADRVILVVSPEPDPAEAAAIDGVLSAAHESRHGGTWVVMAHGPNGPVAVAARQRARFEPERVLNVRAAAAGDWARLGRLATGTGVGLVLGGGGARGFAHLGVHRAFGELRIPIDAVAGSSIGAVFGASIALGLDGPGLTDLTRRSFRRVLDYTVPSVALIKAGRISRNLEESFGGRDLQDLALPCMCVSSNLTTSEVVVHDRGSAVKAIRASLAIPGVIPPVAHDGALLVDGGVLNNLPVDVMRASGLVDTVIAVDVAPPVGPGARHDYGLSVSGWRAISDRLRLRRRRYPRLSTILLRSMLVGSMQARDRLVSSGYADLYLDLDLRGVSLFDFDDIEGVARRGHDLARPRIEAWLETEAGAAVRPG